MLPDHVATLLARLSQGNLRRALLSLEALSVQDPNFKTIQPSHSLLTGSRAKPADLDTVPRPDWEKYAGKAAEKILNDQSPEKLLEVRGMLYELLVHCIPAPLVISVSWLRVWCQEIFSGLTALDEDHREEVDRARGRRSQGRSGILGCVLRAPSEARQQTDFPPRG